MYIDIEDFRKKAQSKLPKFVFEYIDGAANTERCLANNLKDLQGISLFPRVLKDTSEIDTSIEIFGNKWAQPFAIAPTGLNGLIRHGGDGMLAQAASNFKIPFVQSTASNQRVESIAQITPNGEKWLQLYVMQDNSLAEQLMKRASLSGYKVLVLTVDVPVSGYRQRDMRNGFKLPLRPSLKMAWDILSHPQWAFNQALNGAPQFVNLIENSNGKLSSQAQAALLSRTMDRSLVWGKLAWLRKLWSGPIVLKGLLSPDDAIEAIKYGVDGVIVSNHGGRQLDASPSAISALPPIVNAVNDRIPVFMDSGIRSGDDVARAISLGAKAVFIGRPLLYGLAADGQQGVEAVLRFFSEDFQRSMILLGSRRTSELTSYATSSKFS